MAFKIAGVHDFDGPFISTYSLKEESGVYVVLDLRNDGYHFIDAGESKNVKEAVNNHNRKDCWEENRKGTFHYAAYYADEPGRLKMFDIVKNNHSVPCLE